MAACVQRALPLAERKQIRILTGAVPQESRSQATAS